MDRVRLCDLPMKDRQEATAFLKRLWRGEETACPLCGSPLELLHKKAKSSDCDWQCRSCDKVYRTMHLLDELNDIMPK